MSIVFQISAKILDSKWLSLVSLASADWEATLPGTWFVKYLLFHLLICNISKELIIFYSLSDIYTLLANTENM